MYTVLVHVTRGSLAEVHDKVKNSLETFGRFGRAVLVWGIEAHPGTVELPVFVCRSSTLLVLVPMMMFTAPRFLVIARNRQALIVLCHHKRAQRCCRNAYRCTSCRSLVDSTRALPSRAFCVI